MARPRIIRETKRPISEQAPPHPKSVRPHQWLSRDSLSLYREVAQSGRPFDMYISSLAEARIRVHAVKEAPLRLEVMGFMLGEACTWHGHGYSIVKDIGTTKLKSSSSKVRFDPEAFPRLFHDLDDSGFDYVLVGWYHSHPGHTCFLSKTDLETQRTIFNQPYHSAMVVDPVNKEVKTFRLAGKGYEEIAFAVFGPAQPGGATARGTRTRKLRVRPAEQ